MKSTSKKLYDGGMTLFIITVIAFALGFAGGEDKGKDIATEQAQTAQ